MTSWRASLLSLSLNLFPHRQPTLRLDDSASGSGKVPDPLVSPAHFVLGFHSRANFCASAIWAGVI
jgi:hypothetical protein